MAVGDFRIIEDGKLDYVRIAIANQDARIEWVEGKFVLPKIEDGDKLLD